MTFPPGILTIQVTGLDFSDADGTPLNGDVIFTPSQPVYVAGTAVLEGSALMTVTAGVGLAVTIPCTDNVSPPFTYTITQRLNTPDGAGSVAPVSGVSVPHTLGASVDVSQLL